MTPSVNAIVKVTTPLLQQYPLNYRLELLLVGNVCARAGYDQNRRGTINASGRSLFSLIALLLQMLHVDAFGLHAA